MRDSYCEFDQERANKTWAVLNEGIDKIYEKQSFTLSYEELYRSAYYLILHRYGDMTYKNLTQALEANFFKYFQRVNSLQDEDFLEHLQTIWFEAKMMIKITKNIFLYMDKNYTPFKDASIKPVLVLGYDIFKKLLLSKERQLFDKFRREILSAIKSERDGFQIDRVVVKNLLHMLIELGTQANKVRSTTAYSYSIYAREPPTIEFVADSEIYKSYFEIEFLSETKQYYDTEGQKFIQSMTCAEYLKQAELRLNQEKSRLGFYLHSSTGPELIDTFIRAYVVKNCKQLLEMENSGLYFMLQEQKYDEIRRMYRLFMSSSEAFELFLEAFTAYISTSLEQLLNDEELNKDPIKMVENFMQFHTKMMGVLKNALDVEAKQLVFSKSLKDTFELWLNKDSSFSYSLNFYIDEGLRKSFMHKTEHETDAVLSKIIELFKFLQNKDIFEKSYKHFMSRRLLEEKSVSEEYEKQLIEKLRGECGPFYTSKLEIMYQDINISKQQLTDFQLACPGMFASKEQSTASEQPEYSLKLLTQGNWPIADIVKCTLSQELKLFTEMFESYYIATNPGKRINWATNFGSGHLRVNYADRKKEFVMNTQQMCICMLFNDRSRISAMEIGKKTQLSFENLQQALEPLLVLKLFTKTSLEMEINEKDLIEFNEQFTHKNYKIRVPTKKRRINKMAEEKMTQIVQVERKHIIEAAVVRIMKARKMIDHTLLMEEVIRCCSINQFTPDLSSIKQSIESLIAKEYLDRSRDNKSVYIYLS